MYISKCAGAYSAPHWLIRVKRKNIKEIRDCKVILGESVARQQVMVIAKMVLKVQRKRGVITESKIKWKRLHEEESFKNFQGQKSEVLHATDETTNRQHSRHDKRNW